VGVAARLVLGLIGVVAAALGLSTGCGYGIVGVGGQLPGGISRVEVPIFENRTTRSDVGRVLAEDFISKLLASGKVGVTGGAEAQAVVRGVVTVYRLQPITFDAKEKPLTNRLTVVLDVSLVPRDAKRVLFAEKGVTIRYDYPLSSDMEENDRLEDEALRRASELMSQKLVGVMLEGF